MIFKNGHEINRINIDGKEIYRAYFNEQTVFKKYHPVTAIVSTSNKQYINSKMKDFWVDDIDFEITYANNWNSCCVWGCRPDKSYQEFGIILGNDQRTTIRKGGIEVNGTAPNWYQSNAGNNKRFVYNMLECQRGDSNNLSWYDITQIHTIKKVKNEVYLDGVLLNYVNASSCQDFFLTYLPPYFFRLNQIDFELDGSGLNSLNDNGVKYLYRATFYYKDKLYRDFIPVLDRDNVPALYEKVTRKFYYSETNTPLEYFNGNFGQISFIYNCNMNNYINTGILPKDIGQWKMRLQSHERTVSETATNFGMGSIGGLYFTRRKTIENGNAKYYYEIHVGSQVIQTTIPYISDSEILLTFDLISNKVTIECNHQQTLEPIQKEVYDISTEDLSAAPTITLGRINGMTAESTNNYRIYWSKIYDKSGALIQNLRPKINFTTKKACMYDEVSAAPLVNGTLSFV